MLNNDILFLVVVADVYRDNSATEIVDFGYSLKIK